MTSARLPDPALPWPIPLDGVALIAEHEGCRLRAYRCPAGVWTCGWGETDGVGPRTAWTQQIADQRLLDAIGERAAAVEAMCTVPPNEHQLAALVSLAYNIGLQALRGSSVMRAHNAGDHAAAGRAFALWNKARVQGRLTVLPGLTSRRAAEAALYLRPVAGAAPDPMPQAVAAESRLAASPIAAGGGTAAAVGALGLVQQAGEGVSMVQQVTAQVRAVAVDTLGLPVDLLPWAVLVAAGGAVVWWRLQQRRGGWA